MKMGIGQIDHKRSRSQSHHHLSTPAFSSSQTQILSCLVSVEEELQLGTLSRAFLFLCGAAFSNNLLAVLNEIVCLRVHLVKK